MFNPFKPISGTPIVPMGGGKFYDDVASLVGAIGRTKTGQAVFTKIKAHGAVWVKPLDGELNAYAQAPAFNISVVLFSPKTWAAKLDIGYFEIDNMVPRFYPGFKGDEVLIHEFVHAGRWLGGDNTSDNELGGSMSDYDNAEEFVAVMIANIYMSEKGVGAGSLRKDHRLTTQPLASNQATSESFLAADNNEKIVAHYIKQHPVIAPMIAAAPAAFNPVRAYYNAHGGIPAAK